MKELYTGPKAEVIEFEQKDVITTSGTADLNNFRTEAANESSGWTGLY